MLTDVFGNLVQPHLEPREGETAQQATCGCCSLCPFLRTARALVCADAPRITRRGSSSSTRSPLEARPWGPLSSEDSPYPEAALHTSGLGRTPAQTPYGRPPTHRTDRIDEGVAGGQRGVVGADARAVSAFCSLETMLIAVPPCAVMSWVSFWPSPPAAACTSAT
ncbi:hypothetical protein SSPO_003750 [Streptomyces antimycoticus]|uniref:Uncharacterized protein n=1 Tax=Streptomyces antimycoticus TaxID=68175 RepID=A0A499UUU4_9ACTN|nr:hypothetical protein SSPO_003750 [Streptomyces antimycoticus]